MVQWAPTPTLVLFLPIIHILESLRASIYSLAPSIPYNLGATEEPHMPLHSGVSGRSSSTAAATSPAPTPATRRLLPDQLARSPSPISAPWPSHGHHMADNKDSGHCDVNNPDAQCLPAQSPPVVRKLHVERF
ncbi:hypothetical protein BKA70DRAFT_1442976 [Coprinopsis sp. MPI-PUGE-AT-0042]|nr:hypothetical protein BKA70DRAFT_1442976 [Coprinopsis sp. MPI-PUGE-AT-0042]